MYIFVTQTSTLMLSIHSLPSNSPAIHRAPMTYPFWGGASISSVTVIMDEPLAALRQKAFSS